MFRRLSCFAAWGWALCLAPAALAAEPPPLAQVGAGGLLAAEFLYPLDNRPTPSCHASTLAETPAGLVAAWFGGAREGAADVGIWAARQQGGKWSAPREVATGVQSPELRFPCWNPVLFQPADGPLLLFYKVGPSPSKWWGMLTLSADQGETWSPPVKLGEDPKIGHLLGPVKNKPIAWQGGLLCPSSSEHQGWRVHFEFTRDLGKTWEVIGPIHDGKQFAAIQPSLLHYAKTADQPERLQILCRTQQGVISQSSSSDGGKSWEPMTSTGLPNPNSGTDAVTLAGGLQLLVYNHTTRGGAFPSGRSMLNIAVSRDGKVWKTVLTLEREPGEFSYPAVIQTRDGKVHASYTWKRQTIKHVTLDPSGW